MSALSSDEFNLTLFGLSAEFLRWLLSLLIDAAMKICLMAEQKVSLGAEVAVLISLFGNDENDVFRERGTRKIFFKSSSLCCALFNCLM